MVGAMLLAAALQTSTFSAFQSGNELFGMCSEPKGSELFYQLHSECRGFIVGVSDLHEALNLRRYCLPKGVTEGQLTDVAVQWIQSHPAERYYAGAELVIKALSEAFPCQ